MTDALLAEVLGHSIDEWLETALLPLGLKAADLAPETTVEALLQLDIASANSDPYPGNAESVAGIRCSQSFLFGSLEMAARLSGSERAGQIRDRLQGLIWRDGVMLAQLSSLYSDLSEFGPVDNDTCLRLAAAEARWEAWEATNEPAKQAMADFFSDYLDLKFLYEQTARARQNQAPHD